MEKAVEKVRQAGAELHEAMSVSIVAGYVDVVRCIDRLMVARIELHQIARDEDDARD